MNEQKVERQKNFLIGTAFWAVWISLIGLVLKVAGSVLLPFVIAFLVAWILAVPVDFVTKKLHLRRGITAVFFVILFYFLVGVVLYFAGSHLVRLVYDTVSDLSHFFSETVYPVLRKFCSWLTQLTLVFFPEGADGVSGVQKESTQAMQKAGEMVSEISGGVLSGVSGVAAGIPGFFVKLLITVIATVFMELEFHSMMQFLQKQVPKEYQKMLLDGKKYVAGTLAKCVLSYSLILGITFAELCIGFLLLRVDGAFVIAFIIAVLDILPVLGTGAILLPWAIIAMSAGNVVMGVGILVLYIVITIVRNMIEPKLIGKQMGLSPVVMLPCMLLGAKLFGILGLFGVPLLVAFLKELNDQGIVSVFKK